MSINIIISLSIVHLNLLAQHWEKQVQESLMNAADEVKKFENADEVFRPSQKRALKRHKRLSNEVFFISLLRTLLTYTGWLSLFFIH